MRVFLRCSITDSARARVVALRARTIAVVAAMAALAACNNPVMSSGALVPAGTGARIPFIEGQWRDSTGKSGYLVRFVEERDGVTADGTPRYSRRYLVGLWDTDSVGTNYTWLGEAQLKGLGAGRVLMDLRPISRPVSDSAWIRDGLPRPPRRVAHRNWPAFDEPSEFDRLLALDLDLHLPVICELTPPRLRCAALRSAEVLAWAARRGTRNEYIVLNDNAVVTQPATWVARLREIAALPGALDYLAPVWQR